MPQTTQWKTILGSDLIGSSAEQVPAVPAVYAWRRRISPPPGALERADLFCEWVNEEVSIPFLALGAVPVTPSIALSGIRIGGQRLTDLKKKHLYRYSADRQFRIRVGSLLTSLGRFAPNLYVGKAIDLRTRITSHLRGETDFAGRLDDIGLNWDQTSLAYWQPSFLDPDGDNLELLESLEAIVTQLTVGTLVMRIG